MIKTNQLFKTVRIIRWKLIEKHSSASIILIYSLANIIFAIFLYPLIPIILNYAPGMFENRLEVKWFGYSYPIQYIIIVVFILLIGLIFLGISLRIIDKWKKQIDSINISKIREKCLNLPYTVFIIQSLVTTLIALLVLFLLTWQKTTLITIYKISVIVFSFASTTGVISTIFSKRIFSRILIETYSGKIGEGFRISLKTKIILQILPMLIVAVLFTSLIGYSRLIDEKGDLIFQIYKEKLVSKFTNTKNINSLEDIKNVLNKIQFENIKGDWFIIAPGGVVSTNGIKLSKIFQNYIYDLSPSYDGRVSDLTGETQGVITKIKYNNDDWIVGLKYEVASKSAVTFFIVGFIALLGINIFVLIYFSKSISEDISLVARNLNELAEGGKIDLDKKIPVTSNDEIGDLVVAFNKIQDLEKENLRKLKERHEMLIQSERLAALGQMIGGIAHNLKTPIVSIAGGTEALKDLINEYQESVDDLSVTKDDHREIAGEMQDWIKDIKTHCAYMSDIISAVKEQAVQMNYSSGYGFTLEELVKRIEILMKYELKKYNCRFDLDVQVGMQTEIQGELNNLVQIFNNLIINAIQAYDGQGGKINFKITANQHGDLVFEIKDYGKGIAQEIRERLFNEMVTTKGAKGTGMGLYMSYLTVKGKFGGSIWFESEEGKGTSFYLTIPVAYSRTDVEVS